jgi:hypothetical protein
VNPATARSSAGRGKNKGICSFFARSARFSSGRGRISIYFETSSQPLRSPITFRPPRSIPFSSTKPANCTRDHRIDKFQSIDRQLAKVFHHPAPCIAPIQPPFRRLLAKKEVFPARSTSHGPGACSHGPTAEAFPAVNLEGLTRGFRFFFK